MTTKYGTWAGEPEEELQPLCPQKEQRATINVLHEAAANLQYSTTLSAGLDLISTKKLSVIPPGAYDEFKTGISLNLLPGQVAFVFTRSGMGIKHGVVLRNGTGVIDADYKGEVIVCLKNEGEETYAVEKGQRIAQLVITDFQRVANVAVVVKERGTGGFGSTGTS